MEVIETTGAEPDLEGEVIRAELVYMGQFLQGGKNGRLMSFFSLK